MEERGAVGEQDDSPPDIRRYLAVQLAAREGGVTVHSPHRPIVISSLRHWIGRSLSFTANGFFQS